MMIELTYSFSRLMSEFEKQSQFAKLLPSSLNNDRMNMKWLKHEIVFELNLAYNSHKHPTLGGMIFTLLL